MSNINAQYNINTKMNVHIFETSDAEQSKTFAQPINVRIPTL